MDRKHAAGHRERADHLRVSAVILAGGRGERLGALTERCAKPAVPFGGGYRVIDFTLSNCVNSGIARIGVLTQYQSASIASHLRRAWSGAHAAGADVCVWDAADLPSEPCYKGTADAVYRNLDRLRCGQPLLQPQSHLQPQPHMRPHLILVLSGDHVYRMDYREMIAEHMRSGAEITVGCIEAPLAEASRYGVLATDRCGRIDSFAEKPANPTPTAHRPDQALVSMGIYLFDADVLGAELALDAALPESRHDFGTNVIPRVIHSRRVHAHRFEQGNGLPGFWRDIGTLDSYHEANLAMLDVKTSFDPADPLWPVHGWAVSHHPSRFRQPLPKLATDIADFGCRAEGFVRRSNLGAGCLINGGVVVRSILSERVTIGRAAHVSQCVVLPGAVVGEGCRLHRTIVAEGCRVPNGVRLGSTEAEDTLPCHRTAGGLRVLTQADVDRWLLDRCSQRADAKRSSPDRRQAAASGA